MLCYAMLYHAGDAYAAQRMRRYYPDSLRGGAITLDVVILLLVVVIIIIIVALAIVVAVVEIVLAIVLAIE
jgi:hypothetical protein